MEEICQTPNINIKTVELNEGGNNCKCLIQTIKDFLQVSLFIGEIMKQEGTIHLSKIQNQISAFDDYNINEIFEEINALNQESFSIIKEANKDKIK